MSRSWSAATGSVLLALLAVLAWRNIVDYDFSLHMAVGQWIAEHGRVPDLDPFTWTVSDREYVAYHWGFQVLLYQIFQTFGAAGVVAARWAALVAAGLLLADVVRVRRCNALVAAVVGAAGIVACEVRFHARPELATYLLLPATLWVLERHRAGSAAPLWLLPVIQWVWVNTHLYLLGWPLLAAFTAEEMWRRRSWRTPLVAWSALSAVVLFANPYHVRALLHPFHLGARMRGEGVFAQTIIELVPPLALDPSHPGALGRHLRAYGLLLALGCVALPLHVRARRWTDVAIVGVFGAISTVSVRNVALYAIVAVPSLCVGVGDLAAGIGRALRSRVPERTLVVSLRVVHAGALSFAVLAALRVVTGAYYADEGRRARFEAKMCRACLGVDAADWIARSDLRGSGFNTFNLGGVLRWRDPTRPIFIDGRWDVAGEALMLRYLAALDPDQWRSTSEDFGFEYAVIETLPHHAPLLRFLWSDPDWRLVHLDGSAAIFAREPGANDAVPDAPAVPRARPEERDGALALPAERPGAGERLARWIGPPEPLPGVDARVGTTLLYMERWRDAEAPMLAAASEDPVYYQNLGVLYVRSRRWDDAVRALCHLAARDPDHPNLEVFDDVLARSRAAGLGRARACAGLPAS